MATSTIIQRIEAQHQRLERAREQVVVVMKVSKVTATVRYSKPMADGSWKSVELGAESAVVTNEQWEAVQASLYQDLGLQLRTLWSNGKSSATESHGEPSNSTEPTQTPEAHWCQQHNEEFQRHANGKGEWYSHRMTDGNWCREK